MENFKVRAWDKKNKKMFQVTSYLAFDKNGNIMAIDDRPIAEFELMLYTGLKDKNGKEIYEGDIISEDGEFADTQKYKCVFNERLARFGFYSYSLRGFITNFSIENLKYFEVIVNIYENEDLLDK